MAGCVGAGLTMVAPGAMTILGGATGAGTTGGITKACATVGAVCTGGAGC